MKERISWLHLTDLHWGQPRKWLWPGMRQHFKDDLELWTEKAGPWDVVFFSGDFVQQGSKEEFSELTEELVKLWEHLNRLGSNPVIVAVPGNHDLLRPGDTNPVCRQSSRWHQTEEEAVREEFWDNPGCVYRTTIAASLRNYSDWITALPLPQPAKRSGILPGDFSATIPIGNLNLGVVGLNTTYLQLAAGNYEGKLDIHTRQLLAVCDDDPDAWRRNLDIAVLMTHQPPGWLHSAALEQMSEICAPERFHAHLCGHLHGAVMKDVREAGGPTRRLRQGPSLFGLEEYGPADKPRLLFGYSMGKWEIDGTDGTETVWPRLGNKIDDGRVILGPNTQFQLTVDSSVLTDFRTTRPQKSRDGSSEITRASTNNLPQADRRQLHKVEEQRIVLIERPIEAESARQKLKDVPRFTGRAENQHRVVRVEEQTNLLIALKERRKAWLVSDWGYGKDGFLATAIEQIGDRDALVDAFTLQCGGVETCDGLQVATETQLGLSFQEFLAAAAALPSAVLILDDLPASIIVGAQRAVFERIITRPIIDFCPELRLIYTVRQEPPETSVTEVVSLKPLDIYQVRNYLKHHPHSQPGLEDVDVLARIHKWSEGLPMQLDRLLDDLRLFSLSEILDEDAETPLNKSASTEPVPHALQLAVSQLANSGADQSKMSFRLLKVLTVLRDGEIFQSIKRFYTREPFYPQNVAELTSAGLVEVVPIAQTAADLTVYAGRRALAMTEPAKLLRVPRQVRDYVGGLIDSSERADIIRTSTELLFGQDWWRGKIRLRNALFNSYSLSAIVGPGNEHVIARHLLVEALQKGNKHQIQRMIRLGLGLCHRLMHIDRFRDAMTACGAMVHLLRETDYRKDYVEALKVQASALRMVDRHADAVDAALAALEEVESMQQTGTVISDETKGEIYLTLALVYNHLDKKEEALAAAESVIEFAHAESNDGHQARSVVAEMSLVGAKRDEELIRLEESARNRGHVVAANNIAINLSRDSLNIDDSLRWLDKVIRSAKDNYSRTRGIIEKATVLNNGRRIADLSDSDRKLLSAAYSYSYSQRIGKLLDRCHNVLWSMFMRESMWAPLLRLFRFSSLTWRLTDRLDRDIPYLRELDAVNFDVWEPGQKAFLHFEIHYLRRRRQDQPPPLSA